MNENTHILISGRDLRLLETRGQVLRSAGYRVSTTLEPVQGSPELQAAHLLIVCHTLSAEERSSDLSAIAAASFQAEVLCLTPHHVPAEPGIATLDSYLGPREMLRRVKQVLGSRAI